MITTNINNVKKILPILGGGLPYLGYALGFQRNPIGLLQCGQEQVGEIFSFLVAGSKVTFLSGVKANEKSWGGDKES
jgi:hypothetical protein